MTEPTPADQAAADSTAADTNSAPASQPVAPTETPAPAVPADAPVIPAPAVVTDPAAAGPDVPSSPTDGVTQPQTDTSGPSAGTADVAPAEATASDAPAGDNLLSSGVHADSWTDNPVVPSSTDSGVAGFQTVGDNSAVVDNAALNAQAAEAASVSDTGHIVRGGTLDSSQGTPAGLDVATPDNVHSDGGPTVYTDEEIDRLEALNLEAFEETVQDRLSAFEDEQAHLEEQRGKHADNSDGSSADNGDGSTAV